LNFNSLCLFFTNTLKELGRNGIKKIREREGETHPEEGMGESMGDGGESLAFGKGEVISFGGRLRKSSGGKEEGEAREDRKRGNREEDQRTHRNCVTDHSKGIKVRREGKGTQRFFS